MHGKADDDLCNSIVLQSVCVHHCECVWVDTGSDPRAGGKFLYKKYLQPISSPICKTGTWSCTGEQSALAVSHYSLMVLVGLQGAHTGSERHSQYSCELLARAPGVCIAPAHRTCLVHRCPGLTRNVWPTKAARGFLRMCESPMVVYRLWVASV